MLRRVQYNAVRLVLAGNTETEAANELGLAQSTVSRHIRQAERTLPALAFALPVVRELHRRQREAG